MRKFLIGLAALLATAPAFASLDHWTCSNEQTVLFMVLNTDEGSFHLWDDRGGFLAAAKFIEKGQTKNGVPFLVAMLENGMGVGVAKSGNNLVLAFTDPNGKAAGRFICN